MKITKGISLNVSKKGLGLSAGPKGIKVSRSAQGRITGSVGIPGSGLSYRDRLDRTNTESSELSQESNSNAFLEDVAEEPYRIDRMLTHLKLSGVFDQFLPKIASRIRESQFRQYVKF